MKYRAWREYRDRYPELVVLTEADEFPELTRAVEALLPASARARLEAADLVRSPRATSWCAARPGEAYLIYATSGATVELDLSSERGTFGVSWIDPATGTLQPGGSPVTGGATATLTPPAGLAGHPTAAWLTPVRPLERGARRGREPGDRRGAAYDRGSLRIGMDPVARRNFLLFAGRGGGSH